MKKLVVFFTLFSCVFAPVHDARAWNSTTNWAIAKIVIGLGALAGGVVGTKYCHDKYEACKNDRQKLEKLLNERDTLKEKRRRSTEGNRRLQTLKRKLKQLAVEVTENVTNAAEAKDSVKLRESLWGLGAVGGIVLSAAGGGLCLLGAGGLVSKFLNRKPLKEQIEQNLIQIQNEDTPENRLVLIKNLAHGANIQAELDSVEYNNIDLGECYICCDNENYRIGNVAACSGCGAYAHKHCAQDARQHWRNKCPVCRQRSHLVY